MLKAEFLCILRMKLVGLPEQEVMDRIIFYSEMIDDRMDDGLTEEEAVGAVGDVDAVVNQIISDIPLKKIVKDKIKKKGRLKAWEIALIIVGSPIWISLLVSAFAVCISVYASVWAVLVSLWATFGALAGSSIGLIAGGIIFSATTGIVQGIVFVGAGIASIGVAVFTFIGSLVLTRLTVKLTKSIISGIKKLFIKKEATV